jgi:hypothetical protein
VGVISAVTKLLVENLQEDTEDGIASTAAVGFTVNVVQNDVDVGADSALDIAGEHGILDLAVEELDSLFGLSVTSDRPIFEQIGEDLEKVGFTRAEEARDSYSDFAGDVRI